MLQMTSLLIALASYWVLVVATAETKSHKYTSVGLDDKLFADNIAFEAAARSRLECGVLCNRHESCLTYTFHQNTCRGHGVPKTGCSASTPATGARSLARKKENTKTGVHKLAVNKAAYYTDDWIVIQSRYDGSVNFDLTWMDYVNGFGTVTAEHWLGLEAVHAVTTSGVNYELRVNLVKQDGTFGSAAYYNFSLGPAAERYRLYYGSFLGGTAGDSLAYHRGMKFSTQGADNDETTAYTCSKNHNGAWWYKDCNATSNLNGKYIKLAVAANTVNNGSVFWASFTGGRYPLKSCQMMIRPQT